MQLDYCWGHQLEPMEAQGTYKPGAERAHSCLKLNLNHLNETLRQKHHSFTPQYAARGPPPGLHSVIVAPELLCFNPLITSLCCRRDLTF